MIKFFKNIRKNIISENKSVIWNTNYFKYAIGEIILVMIGILLALQVNEWNKERIRQKSEQVIIEQLITDLSQSQNELEEQRKIHLRFARRYAQVLRAFWKTELPDDVQKYVISGGGSAVYSPVMGTAHSLINSGKLDIISSKVLKNDIVTYVEEVGYKLKDINRYEESYFRTGVAMLIESFPNSYRSKEAINEQGVSSTWRWAYNNNLNSSPEFVDKVPFKSELHELFVDKRFFIAHRKLHLYHRNISFKYNDILTRTNELLVKLYLASDKYQELGEKLIDSEHYLVFDNVDLEILQRADTLLSDSSEWNKNHNDNCDHASAMGKFSLECALKTASQDVVGEWEDDPNRPAIRLIILKLLEDENRRFVGEIVEEWNNHPDTKFEEVKNLLKECIDEVKKQLQ